MKSGAMLGRFRHVTRDSLKTLPSRAYSGSTHKVLILGKGASGQRRLLVPHARDMTRSAAAGLALMIGSEAVHLARVEPFWSWNTPICWTGFILFSPTVWCGARGAHRGCGRRPASLPFSRSYRFRSGWSSSSSTCTSTTGYHVGLPENQALRLFGYAWSFGTIWPAIFEGPTSSLYGRKGAGRGRHWRTGSNRLFCHSRPGFSVPLARSLLAPFSTLPLPFDGGGVRRCLRGQSVWPSR